MDYLSAQSTFLRGLFSGASPLDLINTTPNYPPTFNIPHHTPSGKFTIPANRLPRLLPSPVTHPVVFLPVPDPLSFHLLIHWIYFGCTDYIEACLNQGIIQWEGIARNVEYLGLSADIKVFLGRWFNARILPERTQPHSYSGMNDDDDDDDDPDTDMDDDDEGSLPFSGLDSHGEEAPLRGRSTATRPLTAHRHRSA